LKLSPQRIQGKCCTIEFTVSVIAPSAGGGIVAVNAEAAIAVESPAGQKPA